MIHNGDTMGQRDFLSAMKYLLPAILWMWILSTGYSEAVVYQPGFFDAAANKPVLVEPANSICGLYQKTTFCQSKTFPDSVLACNEEDCEIACPQTDQSVHEEDLLVSATGWDDCVVKDMDFRVAGRLGSYAAHLKGDPSRGNCFLSLRNIVVVQLMLQNDWNNTVSMWINSEMQNIEGTLLHLAAENRTLLRISLSGTQLTVETGTHRMAEPSWQIPLYTWTHLALQIFEKSLSVLVNGQLATPAKYDIPFESNQLIKTGHIGKSINGNDPYIGYLQNVSIHFQSISNRQIEQLYTGTLRETRILSECFCPPRFPNMKESDPTFCTANDGYNSPKEQGFRLNHLAHPAEFINDGKIDTAWISQPLTPQTAITIFLGDTYEVRSLDITFYSPFPDVVIIKRQVSHSSGWEDWQYYSEDCPTYTGYLQDERLTWEADVNCKHMVPLGTTFPYSMGKLRLDLLEGRPGLNGGRMTSKLRQFLKASAIRITLRGHSRVNDDRHKYHGIYDVKVNATCDCHGHGQSCNRYVTPYECECAPGTHTRGRQCDLCVSGSYRTADSYDPDLCHTCNCSRDGSVTGSDACEEVGGQCRCKNNVVGRQCDKCKPGYFGLSADNPEGCSRCDCDAAGVINATTLCDPDTGVCQCKRNVKGVLCDTCKDSFYSMDPDNSDGCKTCVCDPAGTLPDRSCDKVTGKCACKNNVRGDKCDECVDGYYNLRESNPAGCSLCDCDRNGALHSFCSEDQGQCICRDNVIGRSCDRCMEGYFATDEADLRMHGCSHTCDCNSVGTQPDHSHICEAVGGQCRCKNNSAGRSCDRCKPGAYGFGQSLADGCLICTCHKLGTVSGKDICDDISGNCYCREHVEGSRCDRCTEGFFGLGTNSTSYCRACDCQDRGSVAGTTCDRSTGQCDCIPGAGDLKKSGRTCRPYIDSIKPMYGPLAGGTNITISGGFLGNTETSFVRIADVDTPTVQSKRGSNELLSVTQPLTSSMVDVSHDLTLVFADGTKVTSSQQFIYKSDPVINSIKPLRSFVGGGIVLTVTGRHLNSVAHPIMEIKLVYKSTQNPNYKELFESECKVKSETVMLCLTPEIKIPAGVKRMRRDTETIGRINSDTIQFYIGFRLDGVNTYRNMSSINSRYGILYVYHDPVFERFDGTLRTYRPFWPFNDNHLTLKGDRLNQGATADDYVIEIGKDLCKDIELFTNRIICIPPAKQPEPSDDGHMQGSPSVKVQVGKVMFVAGYVHYEHTLWEYMPFRLGIIIGIVVFFFVIIVIVIVCVLCRRYKRMKDPDHAHLQMVDSSDKGTKNDYISAYSNGSQSSYMTADFSEDMLDILPTELKSRVEDCLISDSSRMLLGKVTAEGHLGKIHAGGLFNRRHTQQTPVAIKTIKEQNSSPKAVMNFLQEATMMKEMDHENVLSLIGIMTKNNNCFVLMPFMENGDLKTFVTNEENMLTVGDLLDCALQVCQGMCYLSDCKTIHKDLACRNCMVNKDLCVKVADTALSEDIYSYDYHDLDQDSHKSLPIKWMAIESLENAIFTTKSDVWSFGVVVWELLTRGCTPYPDVKPSDMKAYLLCRNRMDRPDYSPDEMYSLMLKCWDEDPDIRSSFHDIHDQMSTFLDISNARTLLKKRQSQQVPITSRPSSYLTIINVGEP